MECSSFGSLQWSSRYRHIPSGNRFIQGVNICQAGQTRCLCCHICLSFSKESLYTVVVDRMIITFGHFSLSISLDYAHVRDFTQSGSIWTILPTCCRWHGQFVLIKKSGDKTDAKIFYLLKRASPQLCNDPSLSPCGATLPQRP
ncbi:hypothetical protein RvY_09618-1 [Ramazzottius varieornatus]|uniref:Uncharacterized protein n=1 Tax=Ramazzottius varieornatus TaxID=947166 RepID=A0A1D1VJ15_RAMVA|nr:hypothetical protein RvY_09618-1 [Ramazzottius varieornatus]